MKYILILIGALLSGLGACMSVFSNFNLGVMLTLLLGIFLLCCGIFYATIKKITQKGAFKRIKITVIALLCAEFALVCFTAMYGLTDNVDYHEDAVIVLGAAVRGDRITQPLKYRLDKAVEYYGKNKDAVIVVTGGQGLQESVTEASAMEKYLLNKGIPADKIIKEEKATSTNENMRFSKAILDKRFDGEYKIAVITNNFHVYRGVSIAKIEGFENVTHMHADLHWYNLVPCYLRESLAILKMWVFG